VVASGSRDGAGILLPGRTGFLLDDARPQAIANALRELIDDAALRDRLGESAIEHARERFDPLRNASAVEAVYDELLGLEPEEEPAVPHSAAVAITASTNL
jgi:glycosyltransferase involved in cell wall biosynthesis